MLSKAGRIPAILLTLPLNERIRELLGSKSRAERLARAGTINDHVAPGSKSALHGLPSSMTVRYSRLSSYCATGAGSGSTLLVVRLFLFSFFSCRLRSVHRWSSDRHVNWRQLADQL